MQATHVMSASIQKIKYILKHWKLGYHIIVGTNQFGVNNNWWQPKGIGWMFGVPVWKQIIRMITIYPLIKSYQQMKWRAIIIGFMHPQTVKMLWGNPPYFKRKI